MFKRYCKLGLSILIFLSLVVDMPASRGGTAYAGFNDIAGHWAEYTIVEMESYGIMSGYPDGSFKPSQAVTFLEAVVMIINTLGLEEDAKNADLSGLKFPTGLTWGKGHLAVAVQKGMINGEGLPYLDPKKPAKRYEVASLIALAVGFQPNSSGLNFADLEKIPTNYRGYVGSVVINGIMTGLPGNLFAPEMAVDRAQMCVTLSRLIDGKWVNPDLTAKRVKGWVTLVDLEASTLVVKNILEEVTVKVTPACVIVSSGVKVDLSAVQKNDRVKLVANQANQVLFLQVLGAREGSSESEGVVASLMLKAKGYEITINEVGGERKSYILDDDTVIYGFGKEASLGDVKQDFYVKLLLDKNKRVYQINIFPPSVVKGTVVTVDRDNFRIRAGGEEKNYKVAENVKVTKNLIRNITFGEIQVGERVEMVVFNDNVYRIDCLSVFFQEKSGVIFNVNENELRVIVNDKQQTYKVSRVVQVVINSQLVDINKLKRGDNIIFEINNNNEVEFIKLFKDTEGTFEGTLTSLYLSSTPSITINMDGLELRYGFEEGYEVYHKGDMINLDEVLPGMKVRLKVEKSLVKEVELLDNQNFESSGNVVNINESRSRITLKINGRLFSYDLSPSVIFMGADNEVVSISMIKGRWVKVVVKEGTIDQIKIQ